ncbi:glycoside hydrolase family 27 protein [Aestuariibaculum suncheonense]|uniref:Alpha-galactosidase n=1 Tax=Aestuariibaculum suncheonense TaxID=1028745 RepID=A0A8J6QGV2_9FLAO|nr:glycoside hydrolase family 27 protein [Aestuariibaculum suncheonense]MBD0835251.1 glycoside hydrolase family 27 protein [Aestuariibaculum suncheonense]
MRTFYFFLTILLIAIQINAQKFQNLALTPPMGWNSWNHFECDGVNETVIKEMADAMIINGLNDVGYQYIVIDDCWQVGRDTNGCIIVDKEKFPSGMKALADYVHSKGLKFGIYSDAGTKTCAGRPGSKGYELKDAETYAKWGVDYLKYDWCNTQGQDARETYAFMRDALFKAGRPIVFSMCEWGENKPWEWAQEVAHLYRTTYDIDMKGRFDGDIWGNQLGWTEILDKQVGLEKYAGPGHWNDPDMLAVGNSNMTTNEARAHFTMWCMLAAPLMAGNDLRSMSVNDKNILTNKALISVNQDELGKQGFKIEDFGNFEIWQKELSKGDIAICFFNREFNRKRYNIDWESIPIKNFIGKYSVIDLWNNQNIGTTESKFTIEIPSRDVVVYRLKKVL